MKHFLKSTNEDVQKMLDLRKQGLSFLRIGRILNVDHTSVIYWVKKLGVDGKPNIETVINITRQIRKEKLLLNNLCVICKGEKRINWKNTDYCGLKCWDKKNAKPKDNFYW